MFKKNRFWKWMICFSRSVQYVYFVSKFVRFRNLRKFRSFTITWPHYINSIDYTSFSSGRLVNNDHTYTQIYHTYWYVDNYIIHMRMISLFSTTIVERILQSFLSSSRLRKIKIPSFLVSILSIKYDAGLKRIVLCFAHWNYSSQSWSILMRRRFF